MRAKISALSKRMRVFSRRMTNNRKVLIGVVAICGLVLAFAGYFLGINRKSEDIKTVSSKDIISSSSSSLKKQPADKSDTCNKVDSKKMSMTTGIKIRESYASIVDTKTSEGMTSGCTYLAESGEMLQNIQIINRNLLSSQAASDAFTQLTSGQKDQIRQERGRAFLISDSQVIKLQERTITTILVIKQKPSINNQQVLERIADLY